MAGVLIKNTTKVYPGDVLAVDNITIEIKDQEFAANYDEPRQGDIKESYAKVDKAAEVLNWKSTVELKQGLQILLGAQNKELNKKTA